MLSIAYPNFEDTILYGNGFSPSVFIKGIGNFKEQDDIPIRAQIWRCARAKSEIDADLIDRRALHSQHPREHPRRIDHTFAPAA